MSGISFARNAVALAGGTAGAQVIAVAALPALTRLYSPADFELLAVYLAALGILASIACLRFEIAIPLPEPDEQGAELLAASLFSVVFVASFVGAIVLIWPEQIADAMGNSAFTPYAWLLPLGVLLTGIYASFQYWANRKRRFGQVARSRLVQAGTGVGTQLVAGAAGFVPGGLLFGHMLYGGAGAMGLLVLTIRRDREALAKLTPAKVWRRVREFRRFPTYSTLEALANSAAIQLPVLFIAMFAIGPEAGFVLLASRVMGAPMQLIGSAISQAYLAQAPEELRAGRLRQFTLGILKPLAWAGIPGMLLAALVAPAAFEFVFGEDWRRAGILLQWMTPWFIMQFLSAPVSMILHVTRRQRAAMALQMSGLVLRVGIVLAAGQVIPNMVAEAYALSGFVFYGIYFMAIISVMNHQPPSEVVIDPKR